MPIAEDYECPALDVNGDLQVDTDSIGIQTFHSLVGDDYVRQSVRMRLETALGERVLHPKYGLDFIPLEVPFNDLLLENEIMRALNPDPNIEEVRQVDVEFTGRIRRASSVISFLTSYDTEVTTVLGGA